MVENESAKSVKIAGPGGQVTVESNADPVAVSFDSDAEIGLEVKAWWVAEPRQLCQIFTPWDRTIVVSGTRVIRCRSR